MYGVAVGGGAARRLDPFGDGRLLLGLANNN
jgi:hypothetical protein